ncbi:MAG: sigma 54-interacting transcriptional regulator, partial [Bacillota bacterium]
FDIIIGQSEIIKNKINKAAQVARTNSSIVISGKTGTGKEIFARTIHCYSKRKGDFIPVNCSAIPESLFESEMFGYVEGAFTGASNKGRLGKFQRAHKGTLFLDEIEALPLTMQPKLLRVLQDKEIVPVGSDKKVKVDVRIIAATNENLRELVEEGKFREDLYYRLNVVEINLPELRQRKSDIPLFIRYFIEQFCKENNIYNQPKIESEVLKILMNYNWKGNVRELKNTVEHLVLFSKNGIITKENIPEYILSQQNIEENLGFDLNKNLESKEISLIKKALDKTDGNKKLAAELLNIPRSTLYYKLKNHNLKEFL